MPKGIGYGKKAKSKKAKKAMDESEMPMKPMAALNNADTELAKLCKSRSM